MLAHYHGNYFNASEIGRSISKIYFRDSGIWHALLGVNNKTELLKHPKLGASWEGFALEEIIRFHQVEPQDCYFWGIQQKAELDLLIIRNGSRVGFEFKYKDAPRLTPAMEESYKFLNLDALIVIYPGHKSYPLKITTSSEKHEVIQVCGLEEYIFNPPFFVKV